MIKPILIKNKTQSEYIENDSIELVNNKLIITKDFNSRNPFVRGAARSQQLILINIEAEIVEGDWFIVTTNNLNEIHQFGKNDKSGIRFDKNNGWAMDCKKIISLTNESHKIPYLTSYGKQVEVDGVNQVESLPQLSPKSIQLLIDYYNEHKCMPESVDCETISTTKWDKIHKLTYEFKSIGSEQYDHTVKKEIKLNQQGKIDITIPEVEEKLYTRADIIHAFTSGHNKAKSGLTHGNTLLQYKEEQKIV